MEVKAIRDCFVGSYRKAQEEFEYSGPKNTNLQPLGGAKWPAAKPEKPSTGNPVQVNVGVGEAEAAK
jgi:hypothetical protein